MTNNASRTVDSEAPRPISTLHELVCETDGHLSGTYLLAHAAWMLLDRDGPIDPERDLPAIRRVVAGIMDAAEMAETALERERNSR